ncbi:MAG: FKBP-type peptidyl-prolyl cis-trans isomerase N-terminal domain-containing protein, partial [Verrucomicrobia bacterium]|nr:FKBP-type peptidyl-prolyl cis-trans isomerase N-terminal domain-containing protein [Verrucomicrobiota bacterium]
MFAKLSIKYLLLAGTWVCLASVPAFAGSTTTPPPATPAAAEPPKKKIPTKEELLAPEYVKKLSQTYGHFIRKNLDNPVVKLNVTDVMKGMQDATDGKPAPLKDGECEEAFRLLQQYAQEEMLKTNLEESETF